MSKKCPDCGSLNVEEVFDNEAYCKDCFLHCAANDLEDASVFDRITASPEVLAPQFIFKQWHAFDGKWGWFSLLLMDGDELNSPWFKSYEEAIAATVEKLKELEK